jgi:hypothetical protein
MMSGKAAVHAVFSTLLLLFLASLEQIDAWTVKSHQQYQRGFRNGSLWSAANPSQPDLAPSIMAQVPDDEVNDDFDPTRTPTNRRRWLIQSTGILGGAAMLGVLQQPALASDSSTTTPSTSSPPRLSDLIASQQQASSSELEPGLLQGRVEENVLSPPPYGMEGTDIFYPSWLSGTWNVSSTTTTIQAPCGVVLFGGNATYQAAQKEVGSVLRYQSRFVPTTGTTCTADREYNVKAISKAVFGVNSVIDISEATPNKFSVLLSPTNAPSLIKVDLITNNRRQEAISETEFHCSEVVRQIVSSVVGTGTAASARPALLKEVETTSLYAKVSDTKVTCRQRSATFLVPSQQDPIQFQMYQATRGRPVDVRFYDVVYTKQIPKQQQPQKRRK